jgi:hypothetical protein
MQAEFNPFNARQREHEEMMIRQLEDDDGDDEDCCNPFLGPPTKIKLYSRMKLEK